MYIGVDGCSAGWIAVCYDEGYSESNTYDHIDLLWNDYGHTSETILIDIPIGLREKSGEKRPCDNDARNILGRPRGSSVFPVPIRAAVHAKSYEVAKNIQESQTDVSLGIQSWNISDKIAQLDTFLRNTEPEATDVIREAHPEICYWAFNNQSPTEYSKTQQPAAAFWERVGILEMIDPQVVGHIQTVGSDLDIKVGNDDIIDAFALALTASQKSASTKVLPIEWPEGDPGDPTGLPMEMVYSHPLE